MHGFSLYDVYMDISGEKHLVGKFALYGSELHILCNYYPGKDGLFEKTFRNGPVDGKTAMNISSPPSPFILVAHSDRAMGKYLDDVPNMALNTEYVEPPAPLPEQHSIFEYHRVGMNDPHIIEFSNGQALLDNKALEEEELNQLLDNVEKGLATLKYRNVNA